MAITVCPVTQSFAAEIGDVDLAKPLAPTISRRSRTRSPNTRC